MNPLVTRHSSLVTACAAALAAIAAPALDFSTVAAVTIPEGAVESISTLDGDIQWKRLYDKEVEWIESSGTQWIDTGYVYNANSVFVCDAMLMEVPEDTWATMYGALGNIGTAMNSGVAMFLNNTVPVQGRFGSSGVGNMVSSLSVQSAVGVRHVYGLASKKLTIDANAYTRGSFTFLTLNRSIFVCSCNNPEYQSRRACSLRLFAFTITENGVLVRDFVPVRKDGEGCLYDRVSGQLYRNQGTGAFVVGPDKTNQEE